MLRECSRFCFGIAELFCQTESVESRFCHLELSGALLGLRQQLGWQTERIN